MAISNYIVRFLAPRVFAVMKFCASFDFLADKKSLSLLPPRYFIISNHQSLLDIPCYMNFLRNEELRFVAKDTLARHVPVVSEMLRSHEHCIIPRRGGASRAMKEMENFAARLLSRHQVGVLFPEGTRSRDGKLGAFHSAGFRKLCEKTRLPVAVCALSGGHLLRDLFHIVRFPLGGAYRVAVLKVFDPPENKEEEMAILNEAKVLISQKLDEWNSLSKAGKPKS